MERKLLQKIARFYTQNNIELSHDSQDLHRYLGQLKKQLDGANEQVLSYVKKELTELAITQEPVNRSLPSIYIEPLYDFILKDMKMSLEVLKTFSHNFQICFKTLDIELSKNSPQ